MLNYKIKVWHMSIWWGEGRVKWIVQRVSVERCGGTSLVKAFCKLCAHAVVVVGYFQIVECIRVIAGL